MAKTKRMSALFNKKSQKEYENLCNEYYTELNDSLKQYCANSSEERDTVTEIIVDSLYESDNDVLSTITNRAENDSHEKQPAILLHYSTTPGVENKLANCLYQMLLSGYQPDLKIKVESEIFLTHKCVLNARSTYFQAMLGGNYGGWAERDSDTISLVGISAENFAIVLLFIYGCPVEMSMFSFDELVALASAADMYGAAPVMNAVEFCVKKEKCHFFHKPCEDCTEGIRDALYLSSRFNLTSLRDKCLKWNGKHFKQLWATKKFCMQRKEIHEECYSAVVASLNKENITQVILDTDVLLAKLGTVNWGGPIQSVVNKLMTACLNCVVLYFVHLSTNKEFLQIFQGIGYRTDLVENLSDHIVRALSVENACSLRIGTDQLLKIAAKDKWNENVSTMLKGLDTRITTFMLNNYHGVLHTEQWHLLSSDYRKFIQQNTLCVGDIKRKPKRKPILSSSMKTKKH